MYLYGSSIAPRCRSGDHTGQVRPCAKRAHALHEANLMKRRTYGPGRRQRRCAPGGRVATRRRQVGFEQLEARRLLATSVWDGGGDGRTWLDPLNWSDRQVPSAGTDVLIPNVAATSIINLPTSGTLRLHSLQSAEHLVLSGATLSLDTPSTLARLTMSGGTLSGTGEVTVTGLFD